VERTLAWEDTCKRLVRRFERIQQRHYGMKVMAYTLINLRGFCVTKTRNQFPVYEAISVTTTWRVTPARR
jgi:hypothetical protein